MPYPTKEKISLAPKVVIEKALELKKHGLYKQALEILIENRIEVEVYNDHMNMKMNNKGFDLNIRKKEDPKNKGNYFKSDRNWKRGRRYL